MEVFDQFAEFGNQTNVRNCHDIVAFLIQNQFSGLTYDDKLYVKNLGVPRPDLANTLINLGKYDKSSRSFVNSWYDKCDWLTGSLTLNKLFCWPCVLFANRVEDIWSRTGFQYLKNLSRSIERHSKTQEHISCTCKLHLFGKQNMVVSVPDSARQLEIEKFNDGVRRNREIVKRLIDICLLCDQRGHELDSLNRGDFKELVSLMTKRDDNLKYFFHSNSVFASTSNTIQNELIDSITHVVKQNIETEIQQSPFFAWQVDETTDQTGRSQLSIVMRYMGSRAVVERFMGFYEVDSGRSAEHLLNLLTESFCSKFDCENKLIAQTYDGAAVLAEHLKDLQVKVNCAAPQALFTHCYAHSLSSVLSSACSSIPQVRIFFASLSAFSSYFSKCAKRRGVLDTIGENRLGAITWNFTSRAVSTVHTYKSRLIKVFDHIIENPDFGNLSITGATGLKNSLQDCTFTFYLDIFHLIFQQTDVLFSVFPNKFGDIVSLISSVQALNLKLRDLQNHDQYFDEIFEKISFGQTETKRRKLYDIADFKQIYNEILDTVCNQMEIRFAHIGKLQFFDLLNISKFKIYSKSFPQHSLECLLKQYNMFDFVQLKNELGVLYSDKILGNSDTPLLMLKCMADWDLNVCMPELYKLICLTATIPITSASIDRNVSILNQIKSYGRNATGQDRLSNMSVVSINRNLVKELRQNETFFDEVIDHFSDQKDRNIPLKFKRS